MGWLRGLVVVGLLLTGFALKGSLLQPPRQPVEVGSGEFNAARAMTRLERILGNEIPHPVDSVANDAVRGRLMAELRAIGLEPQVREAVDCSAMPDTRLVSCSRVRNVTALVDGRDSSAPALLLNAHYDSTPTGPGAADDGVGVATLLEVGSILKPERPDRPVLLLFNEGEEFGLNGSSAFVRGIPKEPRINALINIEARGVEGPVMMFETSDPNGGAIALYSTAERRPYANSLSADFAKLIPNTTDVVEFRPKGWTLLNYAIIGNETRYHTPGDTLAALDRDTLHHMGAEVLAATRAMTAVGDPEGAASGRSVYTDIAGRFFIHLPLTVSAVLLGILLVGAALLAWRRRAFGRPLLLAAGMTIGGTAVASLVSIAATYVRAGDFWRAYPLVTYLAVYAVMLAAMVAIWQRWGSKYERARMRAAAWLWIVLAGAALSLGVPGASIFFLVAPAVALLGIALTERAPKAALGLLLAATAVQFLMFAELLASIEMLLIDGPLWAVAPLAALAALPALVETEATQAKQVLAILAVAALAFWVAALLVPRASAQRPAAFTIDYFRDTTTNRASYAVASKQAPLPRDFPGQWRRGVLPYNKRTRWIADAPLFETPVAQAAVVESKPEGAGRRIRVRLSTGGANAVAIRFPENAPVLALGVPGQLERIPPKGEPEKAALRCSGRSCDGLVIEVLIGDRASVKAEVYSTAFYLPAAARSLTARRPTNAHPQYAPDSTITLARFKL